MSTTTKGLTTKELLDVFSLTQNATGIYRTEDIIIEAATDSMLALWDKDRSVIGKPMIEVLPELEGQPFIDILQQVWRTGVTYEAKEAKAELLVNGRLQVFYFDFIYRAIKNDDGSMHCILHTATDVTERREAQATLYKKEEQEQALVEEVRTANEELMATNRQLQFSVASLSESREQLQLAIESAELGFWNLDPNTQKIMASPRLKELFGFYPDEEMMLEIAIANISDEYRQQVIEAFEAALTKGKPYEMEYPVTGYRDGKQRWLRATGKLFKDEHYPHGNFSGTAADITEQKTATDIIKQLNAELQDNVEKLSEQENTLWLAIRSADIGLWQIDLANNSTTLSDRMKTIHGIPLDREITFAEALSTVGEEFRQSVNEKVVKAVETGELFTADYKINRMDGTGTGWVRSTGIVKDISEGKRKVLIGACIDITERKLDEQRKNDFIGMVSHEMKTPLTSLHGYLQLLQMKVGSEDTFANSMLDKATKQVNKITTLINGFLNVARLESGKIQINKQCFDMAVLVKESEEETASLYSTHRIVFHPVEETFVDADKDKIGQVINNLISNAVKYSPANTLVNVACVTRNGMAVVSVKDEGIGIKPEDQLKLFERYYRVNHDNTTSVSGFGIGLYLCCEIIKRHDGKIWVESEVGKGSTFLFSLPVVE